MRILKELIKEVLLQEEVFGAQAFVYHGSTTPPEKFLDYLLKDTFKAGEGAGSAYGRGLYTVYDLQGTGTDRGAYGKYLYKLKVNLYGFIIFDPDIAKLVYKKELSPAEQAELVGKDELAATLPRNFTGMNFTSSIAMKYAGILSGRVKGIVFTGETDGKVAVIYDSSIVVPVSYKQVTEKDWTPIDRARLKPAITRSATGDFEEFKFDPKLKKVWELKKLPPEERIVKGDLDLTNIKVPFQLPPGLKVTGDLNLLISSIEHLPTSLSVGGNLNIGFTQIDALPPGLQVGGNLDLYAIGLKMLPDDLQVGGNIENYKGPMKNVPKHLKKKITKG